MEVIKMKKNEQVSMSSSAAQWTSFAGMGYALFLSIAILYLNREFYHDDSYITLRYARNFIEGSGIVWNPGEYVQGYTNFLHLILISFFGWLGLDLVLASRIIGVAALGCLPPMVIFFGTAIDEKQRRPLWLLAAILVMTSAPMLVWSIGGLEGTLFSLLVTTGCFLFLLALSKSTPVWLYAASGCSFALSFLTRPDGIVFIVISSAFLLAKLKERPQTFRNVIAFATPVAILVLPYVIWQFTYYGDIVPNTFYAKAGTPLMLRLHSGYRYLTDYAMQPPYLLILVTASLLFAFVRRAWNPNITYMSLSTIGYLLFIIYAGGDHMQAFRFVLPVVGLISGTIPFCLAPIVDMGHRSAFVGIALAILILSSLQLKSGKLNPRIEDPAARIGTIVGKYIASAWPEGSLVALNTAGSTPYYAGRHRFIDMLGLNDSHIAKRKIDTIQLDWQLAPGHLKGDGAYVLSRNPDYIIAGPASGTAVTFMSMSQQWFLSDIELAQDKRFLNNYELYYIQLDNSGTPAIPGGPILFKAQGGPVLVKRDALIFVYYKNKQSPKK
jgi:hypothetical protein